MATTLTPINLVWNTSTATALTALGGAGVAETFTIIPTKPDCRRLIIMLDNLATNKALAVSIAVGDYWAKAGAALTGSVAALTKHMIVLESARYKDKDDDKISVTLTPDAAADAAAKIGAIQIP